jgi:E3 SUMO-protein ligase PIAS1
VDEILRSNSSNVDQVTIEPNGEWYSNKNEDSPGRDDFSSSPDDDLIEILPSNSPPLKQEPGLEYATLQKTPTIQERSAILSGVRQSSTKRPAPQVIDLTGSDDDTPSRPTKRQALDVADTTYPSHRGSQNSFRGTFNGTNLHLSSNDGSLSPGQSTSFYDV